MTVFNTKGGYGNERLDGVPLLMNYELRLSEDLELKSWEYQALWVPVVSLFWNTLKVANL